MDKESALEAKVREHQTELDRQRVGLEHQKAVADVRAEVLSMRGAKGLMDVAALMFQQIRDVGIETFATAFFFVNEETETIVWYAAMVNPRKFGISWTSGLVELSEEVALIALEEPIDPSWDDDLVRWRAGEIWSEIRTQEQDDTELQDFYERTGMDKPMPVVGDHTSTSVPFQYGWVSVRHGNLTPLDLELFQDMTDALSLGYVRYLDFQELESQNEALETALSDLRDTQRELVMQEKMASLGKLTAGISHEMNSPLGAMQSALDVVDRCIGRIVEGYKGEQEGGDLTDLDKTLGLLQNSGKTAVEGAERIDAIVQSLRTFARLDEAEFQLAEIHDGLDSALVLLNSQLGAGVTVKKNYDEIPPIYTSHALLNRVVLHILRNASEATGDSGEIEVSTSHDGTTVQINVRDTGPGIAPEELHHIFDIDFRGKTRTKMGLGLATDYRTVTDLNATIEIQSIVGEGTTVVVALPLITLNLNEPQRRRTHLGIATLLQLVRGNYKGPGRELAQVLPIMSVYVTSPHSTLFIP